MLKYFGTDGIRARAGEFPLTDEFIAKLAYCALKEIGNGSGAKNRSRDVIIAEDSRASGKKIAECLTCGIRAAGFNVVHIGIAPTPAVAYLTKTNNAACGVVISASHNPAEFNGIKFFSPHGTKLSEDIETDIETLIDKTCEIPTADEKTFFIKDENLTQKYINFLKSTLPAGMNFEGLKVVLDCANGASYKTAPQVFKELGADTVVISDKPNGLNINDGAGALHTKTMQETVIKEKAFIGFSFDGDADRLIAADENGGQLDGDNIISAAAIYLKDQGKLRGGKVALTVMANLGLINFLKDNGIHPILTKVGDKYVFEELDKQDLSLGGETSGHVIFRDIANTGDGILAALQLLAIIKQTDKKPSVFAKQWKKYPVKLIPVKVQNKIPLEQVPGFTAYVAELEQKMNGKGRILVRYSGTEPLLRILVEGEDETLVELFAKQTEQFYRKRVQL